MERATEIRIARILCVGAVASFAIYIRNPMSRELAMPGWVVDLCLVVTVLMAIKYSGLVELSSRASRQEH